MRENRNFVVPINILTLFAHAPFLGPHNTLQCVLIHMHFLQFVAIAIQSTCKHAGIVECKELWD